MEVILTCGFQIINIDIFRKKSISKGYKLLKSNHVGHVRETIRDDKSEVTGTVLRETPGATSTRKNENFYQPYIKVIINYALIFKIKLFVKCYLKNACY